MRELLLIAIVASLGAVALFRPKIGLFAYIWFALMRPDVLAWSDGQYPYSIGLAICTLIGSVLYLPRFSEWFRNPIGLGLLLLQVPIAISVLAAVDPSLSYGPYQYYVRVILMAMLILVFVQTEDDLRKLLLLMAISLGVIGARFGFWALLRGGARYTNGYGDTMMSDTNTLALALAMVIPLGWYGRRMCTSKNLKLVLALLTFGSIAAVVMTYSRGGALAAGVAMLLMGLRSKRRVATLICITAFAIPPIYMVRASYKSRIESITDENDSSIRSRNEVRIGGIEMWLDHPLFGVGYGTLNFRKLISNYVGYEDAHVAHNTYVEMLADSGIFAFLLYSGLLFGTIWWLQLSARKVCRDQPGTEVYPYAIQTSLISFAVGSFFLSRVDFDFLYMLLAGAGAWYTVCKAGALLTDEPDADPTYASKLEIQPV